MDKHILQVILDRLHNDEDTSDIVRSYSGRGMFGKECLAIDADGGLCYVMAHVLRTACNMARVELTGIEVEDLCTAVESARTDSLGHSTIVYFPGIPYVETDTEDQDEDANEG